MVVTVDGKSRIALPIKTRRVVRIKPGDKVVIRVKIDGVIELIPLKILEEKVHRVAEKKLSDWREEKHEASRLIEEMVGKKNGGT
jgi:bifunctional DNA-binding transcriptional regulator/antitoxin component of YhaV-PrlF toxin-antitoxin module